MPRLGKPALFLMGLTGYAAGVALDKVIRWYERRSGTYTIPR